MGRLILGDCIKVLGRLPANSIDALVTDPPYGWRFMGKAWDGADIERMTTERMAQAQTLGKNGAQRQIPRCSRSESAGKYDHSGNQAFQDWTHAWAREVFRVLKPGAHALIFCGPRTYHRMACGVEDAGFEVRDQLQWLFGSGFPKSLNVSKAIDRAAGAERPVIGKLKHPRSNVNRTVALGGSFQKNPDITSAASAAWEGFGTALKPANEPILLARKPLSEKTVAANVLKWGTGALNIDGCRVESKDHPGVHHAGSSGSGSLNWNKSEKKKSSNEYYQPQGRFPANLVFSCECPTDQHDMEYCAVGILDAQSGSLKSGASRFFYCAKASKSERNRGLEGMPKGQHPASARSIPAPGRSSALGAPRENTHPTVKPLKLMEYLVRLVTPPGGVVLDPFLGSGTTGIAAKKLGFQFIGIDNNKEYFAIAKKRIR